jgi:hypothetical protein
MKRCPREPHYTSELSRLHVKTGNLFLEDDMNRVSHQDIVKNLLATKAVDFAAIGKSFAEVGPALAMADEPWEGFCGTMRYFVHIYRVFTPGVPVENLGDLANAAPELGG